MKLAKKIGLSIAAGLMVLSVTACGKSAKQKAAENEIAFGKSAQSSQKKAWVIGTNRIDTDHDGFADDKISDGITKKTRAKAIFITQNGKYQVYMLPQNYTFKDLNQYSDTQLLRKASDWDKQAFHENLKQVQVEIKKHAIKERTADPSASAAEIKQKYNDTLKIIPLVKKMNYAAPRKYKLQTHGYRVAPGHNSTRQDLELHVISYPSDGLEGYLVSAPSMDAEQTIKEFEIREPKGAPTVDFGKIDTGNTTPSMHKSSLMSSPEKVMDHSYIGIDDTANFKDNNDGLVVVMRTKNPHAKMVLDKVPSDQDDE